MQDYLACGIVDQGWIDRAEIHQKKKFVSIGKFNLRLLAKLVDLLSQETFGEVEVLVSPDNIMPDKMRAGLIVVKYEDKGYVALGGIASYPKEE